MDEENQVHVYQVHLPVMQEGVATVIRRWRRLLKLSHKELAERSGVNEDVVRALEYGRHEFRIEPHAEGEEISFIYGINDGALPVLAAIQNVLPIEEFERLDEQVKARNKLVQERREKRMVEETYELFGRMSELWKQTGLLEQHNAQRSQPDEHLGIGEGFRRYEEGEKLIRRIIEGEEE